MGHKKDRKWDSKTKAKIVLERFQDKNHLKLIFLVFLLPLMYYCALIFTGKWTNFFEIYLHIKRKETLNERYE
jgi:hypothetical protein